MYHLSMEIIVPQNCFSLLVFLLLYLYILALYLVFYLYFDIFARLE